SSDGLIVVSAFLPVHVTRSDNGEWSADWDYEALLSMQTHLRVTRVGTSGVPVDERHKVEAVLRPFNCVPVWVPTSLFGEMYNGFCKGVLWPILHNGPIHGDGGREAELWAAFTAVNRYFTDVIIQCFNEGDLIWIHGFHLMILPSFLTRRISMAKIGIFLHTPFPSSEIFRTLWCREDLLRGMLNADQVGFHLFEYARHFLTCCRRLLGLNYGMFPDSSGGHNLAIDTNGRHVSVTSIHAGVEPPVLHQVLNHASTVDRVLSIRNQFHGKVIFAAIDRLESLKGIPLKLLGLERFLQRCPEWAGKIVVVQVGISAFERGDDYSKTRNEVLSMVTNINNRWPGTVQFQECAESEMRLQQRMALLRAADIVMVTTIRDGLNLIPLEFTIAHLDALSEQGRNDGRKRGLCILSEFSSCTRVMRGALHVNPWKISEIATAFFQALTMSEDERMRRISIASEFVTRVTTQRWALAVMLDLKGVQKNEDAGRYAGAGLGLGFRLLGMDSKFNSLDANTVARAYRNSKSRLILLDYGGTILANDNVSFWLPTEALISTLKDLCSDKRNTVFVVSGKERHSLTKTLCHIPNLGLAAEHGMFVSWPTAKVGGKRRWETLVPDQDRSWRSIAITIMEVYTSRTHGSYIEETEMKVLWQYRDADPEFGYLQSRELEDHLSNVLCGFSVDILHGGVEEGGYVEVRPKGVNKGVVSMHIVKHLEKISYNGKLEFALVIGDDHCDEPMLSVDVSSCDDHISTQLQCFTSTVGKKPSAAANYVNDVEDVQELLESLVKVT
ncbi:trehalose-6-phosphate synthase, partial [Thalassiosira pseudonana CCMP1335]